MEVVIKISDKDYQLMKDGYIPFNVLDKMMNGTPLPKGHGRMIDADAFISRMEDASKRQRYKELLINDTLTVDDVFKAVIVSLRNEGLAEGDSPTIIEADTESEE